MIVVRPPKSAGVAFILSFLFGPLGMFYSTVTGALVILGIDFLLIFVTIFTLGFGGFLYFFTWIGGIIWAVVAANNYNGVVAVAAAQANANATSNSQSVVNVTFQAPMMGPYSQPLQGQYPQTGGLPQQPGYPQTGPLQQGQYPQTGGLPQPGMAPQQYYSYPQPAPAPNQYPQQSDTYPQDGPRPNQY